MTRTRVPSSSHLWLLAFGRLFRTEYPYGYERWRLDRDGYFSWVVRRVVSPSSTGEILAILSYHYVRDRETRADPFAEPP